jgi:hypothetical protein
MRIHQGSNPVVHPPNPLDGPPSNEELLTRLPGSITNKIQGLRNRQGAIKMRIMTLMLAGSLAIFLAGGEAFAAKRISGVSNPDHNSYQSAAGSCGGSAACYRSGSQKSQKKH